MVEDVDIVRIISVIRQHSDYDFIDYSDKSFKRRVEKVLNDSKLEYSELLAKLAADRKYLESVVMAITVNTTELFRDTNTWQSVRYRVLPKLRKTERINIWHAGCSTGQEPYSMSMIIHELALQGRTKILATDVNEKVLAVAATGKYQYQFNKDYIDNFDKVMRYNPFNYEDVYDIRDDKYFEINSSGDYLQMRPNIKSIISFAKHDLVSGIPPTKQKLDIIICRNVLIYFNFHLQNKVLDMFYSMLTTKGFLVLGKHESLFGSIASKFIKRGDYYTKKNII